MNPAPWKRFLRVFLLALAFSCFAAWGLLVIRIMQHRAPGAGGTAWWLTGLLLAGWAALFAVKALGPDR